MSGPRGRHWHAVSVMVPLRWGAGRESTSRVWSSLKNSCVRGKQQGGAFVRGGFC